jgi:CHAD domain-containing protein
VPLDADRIQKTARKLRKLMKRAPKRPTPDEVHNLRTYIRRLEAAFDASRPNLKRSERRFLRDLRGIRKRAGKIRDMDVLTADAASLRVAQEQDCAVELLQFLGAQRYKHAARLHKALRKQGKELGRRLKRVSGRLAKQIPASNENSGGGKPPTSAEAAAVAMHLSKSLTSPSHLNHGNLHPYRLKVKELRDVLRLAEKPGTPEFVGCLGEIKDAIGEWHDWEELTAIAGEVLDHGANCKLLSKLKEISEDKFERAMSLTVKMRKQFLGARNGKLAGPVLVASAAVAS